MSLDFSMRPEWEALRARARAVAQQGVADYGRWSDSWINGHSKEFSMVLAAEGFIGMTWPAEYGGGGRPGIERIIMAEEMISAGAPIAASWFADRQMGPSIYTYGTETQKAAFLPGMLSGQASWCIGMSEPDAGSDLAALKTSADRDGDGARSRHQRLCRCLGHLQPKRLRRCPGTLRNRPAVAPTGFEEDIEMSKGSSTYLLRLPASLKAAVAEISKEDGTSINQFVTTAVAEKIAAMKTAEFFNARGAEADIEAARRLLRRDGGQPPEPDDTLDQPDA